MSISFFPESEELVVFPQKKKELFTTLNKWHKHYPLYPKAPKDSFPQLALCSHAPIQL